MGTRETRFERGRRRGQELELRLLNELRNRRIGADVSQRTMAKQLGWSQPQFVRFEKHRVARLGLADIAAAASILGLELSANLRLIGDPIIDRGHQALIGRFRAILSPRFAVLAEALFPLPGDARSWDLLLRLDALLIGVEAETRIRDMQALVRRMRGRERDGGVDELLLVLAASAFNRGLVEELRVALGPRFATAPRQLLAALRAGDRLPGSGVVLI